MFKTIVLSPEFAKSDLKAEKEHIHDLCKEKNPRVKVYISTLEEYEKWESKFNLL